MNEFDFVILHFLNQFAHRSQAFDGFVFLGEESNLLKGGIALALIWWAWFRHKTAGEKNEHLLFALLLNPFALLFARAVALAIPYRERPFQNPQYHFQLPYSVTGSVHSWNASPSDHAVLFFCLAGGLCLVSWRLGLIALCHTVFIVCLPRIYVGYHYPPDILAGAIIGLSVASLSRVTALRKRLTAPIFTWMEKYPAHFYALLFLWTFEVAELFQSLLQMQGFVRRIFGIFPHFRE
jgi:undecaprenyl-diphosphatase